GLIRDCPGCLPGAYCFCCCGPTRPLVAWVRLAPPCPSPASATDPAPVWRRRSCASVGPRTHRRRVAVTACVGSALAAGQAAPADTIALQAFSGGTNATSGSDQLYGWQFSVLTAIDVTALGVGDTGGDGLVIAHDVGIFRVSDQSLLASLT